MATMRELYLALGAREVPGGFQFNASNQVKEFDIKLRVQLVEQYHDGTVWMDDRNPSGISVVLSPRHADGQFLIPLELLEILPEETP